MTEAMAKLADTDPNKRFATDWDPSHVWMSGFSDASGPFKPEGGAVSESDVTHLAKPLAPSVSFRQVTPAGGGRVPCPGPTAQRLGDAAPPNHGRDGWERRTTLPSAPPRCAAVCGTAREDPHRADYQVRPLRVQARAHTRPCPRLARPRLAMAAGVRRGWVAVGVLGLVEGDGHVSPA